MSLFTMSDGCAKLMSRAFDEFLLDGEIPGPLKLQIAYEFENTFKSLREGHQ